MYLQRQRHVRLKEACAAQDLKERAVQTNRTGPTSSISAMRPSCYAVKEDVDTLGVICGINTGIGPMVCYLHAIVPLFLPKGVRDALAASTPPQTSTIPSKDGHGRFVPPQACSTMPMPCLSYQTIPLPYQHAPYRHRTCPTSRSVPAARPGLARASAESRLHPSPRQ